MMTDFQSILELIDKEIATLTEARALLADDQAATESHKRGRPKGSATVSKPKKATKKKRNLSPEARARIAAAVKRRWAKQKAGKN